MRALENKGFKNIVTRTHAELDLTDQAAVKAFFESEKPEYVFLAAAKVGGIHANNTYPADFIYVKSPDSEQRDPQRIHVWRQETLLSRQLLHLSESWPLSR